MNDRSRDGKQGRQSSGPQRQSADTPDPRLEGFQDFELDDDDDDDIDEEELEADDLDDGDEEEDDDDFFDDDEEDVEGLGDPEE